MPRSKVKDEVDKDQDVKKSPRKKKNRNAVVHGFGELPSGCKYLSLYLSLYLETYN